MKLLLTGEPGTGKTTLLKGFINRIPDKQGFMAEEVKAGDERIGFRLVSSDGNTAMLASADSPSSIRVSKYGVELESLNQFLRELPPFNPSNLVYVDEIGQMQLYSEDFKRLVNRLLDTSKIYVGTLKYQYDHPFIDIVRNRDDVLVLHIAQENRDELQRVLDGIAEGVPAFINMDDGMRRKITNLARQYVLAGNYIQLRKLFKNAVNYIAKSALRQTPDGYVVAGNHGDHLMALQGGEYSCDCDLFNGRAEFTGNPGECSHIQAVKLLS